jgi:EmrB/QacA subfamily drug resistance transporter
MALSNATSAPVSRAPRLSLIITVLGTCFLVVMMDNTIINVALQTIQRDLHATNSQLQWSVDAYILVYAALMFSAGVLADRYGRRISLVVGMTVFGVASALSALSHSPDQLVFWRAVMGLGGAVVPAATLAVINSVFPPAKRGKAIGVWSGVAGLSIAFGPIIGGALLEHFWWGSVFLINVPIVILCLIGLLISVPETRSADRPRLDVPGVVLSVSGTGLLVFGVIRGGENNQWTGAEVLGTIVGGIAMLVVLVWFESRQANPALDVRLLKNRAFTAGTTSISAAFFALTGGTFLLVFYVQGVLGYSPLKLGLVLLPVAVGTVVSSIQGGPLSRKHGAKTVVSIGLVLLIAAVGWLAVLTQTTPVWELEVSLTLAGLGMGFVMSTTTIVVMSVVEPDKSGIGAAVNNTLRQIGAALGVAVLGSVLSVRYRNLFGDAANIFPAQAHDQASASLGGTLGVISDIQQGDPRLMTQIGPKLPGLVQHARDSYVTAMHTSVLAAVGLLVVGLVVGLLWLPGRRAAVANPAGDAEIVVEVAG